MDHQIEGQQSGARKGGVGCCGGGNSLLPSSSDSPRQRGSHFLKNFSFPALDRPIPRTLPPWLAIPINACGLRERRDSHAVHFFEGHFRECKVRDGPSGTEGETQQGSDCCSLWICLREVAVVCAARRVGLQGERSEDSQRFPWPDPSVGDRPAVGVSGSHRFLFEAGHAPAAEAVSMRFCRLPAISTRLMTHHGKGNAIHLETMVPRRKRRIQRHAPFRGGWWNRTW
jgi:hypothetical protein